MIIFREIATLRVHLHQLKEECKKIGFVPTMGALHEGHLSLISRSKAEADVTVCSIFVNPTQFNDPKDFEKYPITTATDTQLLIKENTDVLFIPSVEEMYPSGLNTSQHYDLDYLETILEGAHRPGHFQGVCQVVHRLLSIVEPDTMFLGQKDFQQCMVLKKLIGLISLPTEIVIVKTVREQSGLAMSSRNMRLSEEQRKQATAIYHSLMEIKADASAKTVKELEDKAVSNLRTAGFEKVDYVEIAEANTLKLLADTEYIDQSTPTVALVAAFIGGVRLIDNMILTE
jgi:pantoate--beta-alanine ligase